MRCIVSTAATSGPPKGKCRPWPRRHRAVRRLRMRDDAAMCLTCNPYCGRCHPPRKRRPARCTACGRMNDFDRGEGQGGCCSFCGAECCRRCARSPPSAAVTAASCAPTRVAAARSGPKTGGSGIATGARRPFRRRSSPRRCATGRPKREGRAGRPRLPVERLGGASDRRGLEPTRRLRLAWCNVDATRGRRPACGAHRPARREAAVARRKDVKGRADAVAARQSPCDEGGDP